MTYQMRAEIPVAMETDILVAGGGLGGVAAALAATRAGAETVLIERNGFLGGVATAGMCCSVFHCMATRDRQFRIRGLPLEIVDTLAVKAGPGLSWRDHKGHMIYDVEMAKLVLHELCDAAGVRVLLDTPVADVWMEGPAVRGVIVTGANGLYAIKAKNVVDATGDSIIAELSGAPMRNHECPMQNASKHSYVFRMGGVDVNAFVDYFRANPEEYAQYMDIEWTLDEALRQYDENGTFLFPHGGGMQMRIVKEGIARGEFQDTLGMYDSLDAMQMHCIRSKGVVHIITGFTRLASLDSKTVSRAVLEGKQMAFYVAEFLRRRMPGFERAYVSQTADDLGIRASRWIDGRSTFVRDMRETAYTCDDAIGIGVMEWHEKVNRNNRAWNAQLFGDDVYQVPLSCLLPKEVENLVIGAGRGASTEPPALLRVMVMTMVCGQGAGVAAAVAAKKGVAIADVPYASVRSELERQGVMFSK